MASEIIPGKLYTIFTSYHEAFSANDFRQFFYFTHLDENGLCHYIEEVEFEKCAVVLALGKPFYFEGRAMPHFKAFFKNKIVYIRVREATLKIF